MSGQAKIARYNLEQEIGTIFTTTLVCGPKLNLLYVELTAEYLYFYACLKGVKWGKEKSVVVRQVGVAERVGREA